MELKTSGYEHLNVYNGEFYLDNSPLDQLNATVYARRLESANPMCVVFSQN